MNDCNLKQVKPTHVMKIICNQDNSLNEKKIDFGIYIRLGLRNMKHQFMTDLLVI